MLGQYSPSYSQRSPDQLAPQVSKESVNLGVMMCGIFQNKSNQAFYDVSKCDRYAAQANHHQVKQVRQQSQPGHHQARQV